MSFFLSKLPYELQSQIIELALENPHTYATLIYTIKSPTNRSPSIRVRGFPSRALLLVSRRMHALSYEIFWKSYPKMLVLQDQALDRRAAALSMFRGRTSSRSRFGQHISHVVINGTLYNQPDTTTVNTLNFLCALHKLEVIIPNILEEDMVASMKEHRHRRRAALELHAQSWMNRLWPHILNDLVDNNDLNILCRFSGMLGHAQRVYTMVRMADGHMERKPLKYIVRLYEPRLKPTLIIRSGRPH